MLLNDRSRRGRRDGAAACAALADAGIDCTREPSGTIDAVVCAGGDGTIVRSIPVAMRHRVPLGIVPLGTFNDLARSLDIPVDIYGACGVIAARHTRAIDVGCVNGAHFVNEASIGLSTRIARRQTPELKQRFGLLAVVVTTLQAIRQTRPFRATIVHASGTERVRTIQLTIANNAQFGGIITRADASVDDGWLDLYSVEVRSWAGAVALAAKILRRDPTPGKGLRVLRSQAFDVRTRRPHHVTADGEPAGSTPARFEVLRRALEVFVPASRSFA